MLKKALLIDGSSLMFRAFYGSINQIDYYIKNNQTPMNALKIVMLIIFKLLSQNNYEYGVIAFDHKDKNFRKKEFSFYKSNRKKAPDELIVQINPIQDVGKFFGLNVFCVSGIEADDVIGSCSKQLNKQDIICDIYSSDKDLLQLVNQKTNVILFEKGISKTTKYTIENFKELNNGLNPIQIIDYKAINGDSSDNIPGIKGIGNKIAIKLLQEFNSLENIYKNLDFIKSKSIKQKLIDSKKIAFDCKKLATIFLDYFDQKECDFKLQQKQIDKIKQIIEKNKFSGFNKYIKD